MMTRLGRSMRAVRRMMPMKRATYGLKHSGLVFGALRPRALMRASCTHAQVVSHCAPR